jgi:hypothetical protein
VAPEGVERKPAAILSADVVGYSRLMAEDEAATVRTLTDYREEIAMLVRQRRGGGYSESGAKSQRSCSQNRVAECVTAKRKEISYDRANNEP